MKLYNTFEKKNHYLLSTDVRTKKSVIKNLIIPQLKDVYNASRGKFTPDLH